MAEPKAWYEAAFGAHYPLLYQHRDEAEARRCLELLPSLAPLVDAANDLILDLGCGDGRHTRWLDRAGHHVVGLDLSPELLAVASSGPEAALLRLIRGDMRQLPLASASVTSVLSLFTAFGYFGGSEANAQPVLEIGRVLRTGGHWFLDYFNSDRVLAELGDGRPRQKNRQLGSLLVSETRRYVADSRQVVKDVDLQAAPNAGPEAAQLGVGPAGLNYREQVQVFTLAELDEMALVAGLNRVASAGNYHGAPLGEGDRWLLVYQKSGVA